MAQTDEHIAQARRNFKFLESINSKIENSSDWQVTTCFYTAVHIVNAHLARFNLHFQSHDAVKNAINPFGNVESIRFSEDAYKAYVKLRSLSRRSRYLVNDLTWFPFGLHFCELVNI